MIVSLVVLGEHARDGLGPEQAAGAGRGIGEHITGQVPEVGSQPGRHRHAEALLAPGEQLGWQPGLHRLLQQELRGSPAELEVTRQPGGPLHQMMVEKGAPGLERTRHRRDVQLHQDVSWQVGVDVDIHDPADPRRRAGGREGLVDELVAVDAADLLAQVVRVDLQLLLRREIRHEPGVAAGRRLAQHIERPRPPCASVAGPPPRPVATTGRADLARMTLGTGSRPAAMAR